MLIIRSLLLWLIIGIFVNQSLASDSLSRDNAIVFIQPEFLIGKTLHAHSDFPQTRPQTVYSLSIGRFINDPNKVWAVFYNYPSVGVTISKTSFGNDQVLGNAYTIMPFLSLNTSKRLSNTVRIKLGLGASYFTNYYHSTYNPDNKAIGSRFTWTFLTSVYYYYAVTKHLGLTAGGTFLHHSNGHTQLPNLGLNSFLFSLSAKVYLSPINGDQQKKYQKPGIPKSKQYFLTFRYGIGFHEFGQFDGQVSGQKQAVNTLSVGAGIMLKQLIKFRTGFAYRFYNHYHSYIKEFQPEAYISNPISNASNIYLYIGGELLIGHVSMDLEIGFNIYKPFYREHSNLVEDDSEFSYILKRTIASRLGLRLYAINTGKNPKNNIFIGAYINANMGQADFTEISIGLVHRLGKQSPVAYPGTL